MTGAAEPGAGGRAPGRQDRQTRERAGFTAERLASLGNWFGLIDAGIQAFLGGKPFPAQKLAQVVPLVAKRGGRKAGR